MSLIMQSSSSILSPATEFKVSAAESFESAESQESVDLDQQDELETTELLPYNDHSTTLAETAQEPPAALPEETVTAAGNGPFIQTESAGILPVEAEYDSPPPSYNEAVLPTGAVPSYSGATAPNIGQTVGQSAPYLSYLPQHLPYPPSSLYGVSTATQAATQAATHADVDQSRLFCPNCIAWTQTQTLKRPSQMQLMTSALLCFIGAPIAACLPFMVNGCWEQERRCGNCGGPVE